jgi:hypothetical protein
MHIFLYPVYVMHVCKIRVCFLFASFMYLEDTDRISWFWLGKEERIHECQNIFLQSNGPF